MWRIRDVYPGSWILIFTHPGSRISDPGSKNSTVPKERVKKNFQYALKYMGLGSGIRDQGSGIRKKPIPDPGSRGLKGTGSRIRIRNTVLDSVISRNGAFIGPVK